MTNSVVIIRNVPTASTGTTIGSRCVPVLEVAVSRVLVGAFIERSRFEWGGSRSRGVLVGAHASCRSGRAGSSGRGPPGGGAGAFSDPFADGPGRKEFQCVCGGGAGDGGVDVRCDRGSLRVPCLGTAVRDARRWGAGSSSRRSVGGARCGRPAGAGTRRCGRRALRRGLRSRVVGEAAGVASEDRDVDSLHGPSRGRSHRRAGSRKMNREWFAGRAVPRNMSEYKA